MNSYVRISLLTIAVVALAVQAAASSMVPAGVSPGGVDRIAMIRGDCPTFSWGAVPGASLYELAAYRLPDGFDLSAELELLAGDEVLYTRVAGGATGWTPDLERCFAPGTSYVWFVRAVFDEEGVLEAGDWSEGLYFRLAAAPSAEEVEQALEVLRRYIGETGGDAGLIEGAAPGGRISRRAAQHQGTARVPADPKDGERSVLTGPSAIRGEMPDPAGETYGVVGASNSPDGAGIGAANTAGGADLVLDGSAQGVADAALSESGIDRNFPAPMTFNIQNSSRAGFMTLQVDGIDVVTTLTDQDTLAGLSCGSNEVAKWNGSSWACAPDVDTDTLAGLMCSSWQVAKWNGSEWVCFIDWDTLFSLNCATGEVPKWNGSAWACAEDVDTTLLAGHGLFTVGGYILIDPAAFSTRITTVDSAGINGAYSSLAIGTDGLGLISYWDQTNFDLKVAHCDNVACTSATTSTLDWSGVVGEDTSIAIGADGLGLITYFDQTNTALKVAHCNDIACTSANVSFLDFGGYAGEYSSVAIGADGLGLVSYSDRANLDLKVAHCDDIACISETLSIVDTDGGTHTSIAIGGDGLGLISYYYHDGSNSALKVAHCNDIACTSATISTLDSVGDVGEYSSVVIGTDGLGLIAYFDHTNYDLKVAHCDDIPCTSATISTLDSTGSVGWRVSIATGWDGLGLISYFDNINNDLKVAHCNNVPCTSATIRIVDSQDVVSGGTRSLATGVDGRGLVSYVDNTARHLKVAHLPIGY